jgi:hypothetical protein
MVLKDQNRTYIYCYYVPTTLVTTSVNKYYYDMLYANKTKVHSCNYQKIIVSLVLFRSLLLILFRLSMVGLVDTVKCDMCQSDIFVQ